ncbi:MAG TPA: sulfite exporter TauE/SafE family protein [Methylomirabilota bacterium]|nr:sulfite exporter TauE/SafE family protein [Methylomirabilota bacterium]
MTLLSRRALVSSRQRMDGTSVLMLFAAGLAGGVVTAIVGGASLITFPAMLAAGLPAIIANASNTVAMSPGNLIAAVADLERRPRWDRSFVGLALICIGGSIGGALLLLATPAAAFTAVVPALIGFATILFALSGRIRQWIVARRTRAAASHERLSLLLFVPVAVYGGYFGAGMSVMLLALLSVSRGDDFRTANVLKNLLSGLTGLVAVVVFIERGVVDWPPTLAMMAGALAGGFLGGRLVRVLPPRLVRWIVIGVGSVLTVIYAWRYWLR